MNLKFLFSINDSSSSAFSTKTAGVKVSCPKTSGHTVARGDKISTHWLNRNQLDSNKMLPRLFHGLSNFIPLTNLSRYFILTLILIKINGI